VLCGPCGEAGMIAGMAMPIDPSAAMEWALETCCHLLGGDQPANGRMTAPSMQWQMPEAGSLKINVDGAYSQEPSTGATGAVLRDSSGNFFPASARWLDSLGSALLAEAEALRDGVRLIPGGTRERIILKTDSQELASLWNNRRMHRSEIAAILEDVEEMASNFISFQVLHKFCSSLVRSARLFLSSKFCMAAAS